MNQFTSSILVLLVVFSFHGVTADVVSDVCRKASSSNLSLTYGFCSSSLGANPKSKTSNIYGLGEISMELTLSKAAYVTSRINSILNGGKVSADVKGAMEACKNYYTVAAGNVQSAINAYKGISSNNGVSELQHWTVFLKSGISVEKKMCCWRRR
ncbi:hypothetical protein MKX01_001347 [Papaver californicum]|nr:hypothetical protein MKX01_001347 [Papaver californicum]